MKKKYLAALLLPFFAACASESTIYIKDATIEFDAPPTKAQFAEFARQLKKCGNHCEITIEADQVEVKEGTDFAGQLLQGFVSGAILGNPYKGY